MGFLTQPRTLESLAISKLSYWILDEPDRISKLHASTTRDFIEQSLEEEITHFEIPSVENMISRQIDIIRDYLRSNMPKKFHNKLAALVMQDLTAMLPNFRYRVRIKDTTVGRGSGWLVEALFTESLSCLSFVCDNLYFGASLTSKSYMLTGLLDLRLISTGTPKCDIDETVVIQLIKELHRLKCFSLIGCKHFCKIDNILKCVAENCKLVEEMILSEIRYFNDNSVDILTQLPNLKCVNVTQTGITPRGVEKLLLSCKNIEHLSTSRTALERALLYIESSEDNAGIQFNLQSFALAPDHLELVVKMCPMIQYLTIVKRDVDDYYSSVLMAVNDLRDLHDLGLAYLDFYKDRLKDVLQIKGYNIIHLRLYGVTRIDTNALISINQLCPHLESLVMSECEFQEDTLLHSASLLFRKLSRLYFDVYNKSWYPERISDEQSIFLLSICPNLEFIEIENLDVSIDDIMLKVLDKNPLIYLKELKVSDGVSKLVVDRLIQNRITPLEMGKSDGEVSLLRNTVYWPFVKLRSY